MNDLTSLEKICFPRGPTKITMFNITIPHQKCAISVLSDHWATGCLPLMHRWKHPALLPLFWPQNSAICLSRYGLVQDGGNQWARLI